MALEAEARGSTDSYGTVQGDLAHFYDSVDRDILETEGFETGFPDVLVRVCMTAYAGPRIFCGRQAVHGTAVLRPGPVHVGAEHDRAPLVPCVSEQHVPAVSKPPPNAVFGAADVRAGPENFDGLEESKAVVQRL